MNDQRKLICWSPHAKEGATSPHANEFLVCSSSLRLFRATAAGGESASSGEWSVTSRRPAAHEAIEPPRTTYALLDTISYTGQTFKCLGWAHARHQPYMVAAGQASGKLVVLNFAPHEGGAASAGGSSAADATSRIVKEFHPRNARTCHVVCWNPVHVTQVAVGLDRVRNGCGTLIWDVEQKGAAVPAAAAAAPLPPQPNSAFIGAANILNTNRSAAPASASIETVTEPLGRVSNSEATISLSWLPSDPYSLAVGTGFKWLRIYDIRGSSRPTSVVAHAKSVNGVTFDPFNPMRLATFSEEGTIKIWDLRMITRKEIFSIHSSPPPVSGRPPKTLVEVEWCPTSQHRISTVHREDDGFRLWDLSGSLPSLAATMAAMSGHVQTAHSEEQTDETKPAVPSTEAEAAADSAPSRSIRIPCLAGGASQLVNPAPSLSSLSWHPSMKQRVLAITSHGLVEDMALHDSVPVGWGTGGPAFAVNEQLFVANSRGNVTSPLSMLAPVTAQSLSPDPTMLLAHDISTRMRVRALMGYGLDVRANRRMGERVVAALRANAPLGDIEAQLALEAVQDEQTLMRVWEWMMQSERLNATMPTSPAAGPGLRKQRFTGVLALLLPGVNLSAVAAGVSWKKPVSASSPPAGTLLSMLKSEGPAVTVAPAAASAAAPGVTNFALSPPSQTLDSSAASGFLPAGFRVYLSRARTEALRLCDGWFDLFGDSGTGELTGAPGAARRRLNNAPTPSALSASHASYEAHLLDLESRGLYEQAARVAVFHLDLERALQSLTLGASGAHNQANGHGQPSRDLGLVAMALSGYANFAAHAQQQAVDATGNRFTSTATQLWNQTWTSALGGGGEHLSPALKSIFSFLSSFAPREPTAGIYASVLDADCLALQDKLGFVLRFLPDDELIGYLVHLTRDLITRGDLDGLVLTGLNNYEVTHASATETTPATTTTVSYTMDLLQRYLDRTSDVQSAAVLGCFAGVSINFTQTPAVPAAAGAGPIESVGADPSVSLSQWLLLYRSLLNQWSMWAERAKFDVSRALLEKSWAEEETARVTTITARGAAPTVKRPAHHTQVRPQISVRCNFCQQSLSLESMSGSAGPASGGPQPPGARTAVFRPRGRVGAARGVPDQHAMRIRGCPHCKKSLPRCALCLVSFDCDTPNAGPSGPIKAKKKNPLAEGQEEDVITGASANPPVHVEDDARFDNNSAHEFGKWFTWCQACRHGGHAEHMADWFQQHTECPVTDCTCLCMRLDLLPTKGQADSSLRPIPQQPIGLSQRAAALQANQNLAEQQAQYRQQLHGITPEQQQQEQHQPPQQESIVLQQIQAQYPNGLPLDVIALAQAIQLTNLARGAAAAGSLNHTPSSIGPLLVSPDPSLVSLPSSHAVSPASAPNMHTTATQMHQSQSSPYLAATSVASPTHAENTRPPIPLALAHVQAAHGMARAGSTANLSGRITPPKSTHAAYPLTRW